MLRLSQETICLRTMNHDHEREGKLPLLPSLPRGLPEDGKFSENKRVSKTLNKKKESLTQTIRINYLYKIFKSVFPFYLSSIQGCLLALHL